MINICRLSASNQPKLKDIELVWRLYHSDLNNDECELIERSDPSMAYIDLDVIADELK